MVTSIRLGKIAGIDIGFNWSVLVIVGLVSWSLSTQALPESAPGHSVASYWAAGGLTALLFFASLLAHELAHSLEAKRSGVGVTEITLWMLGGVSKLERDAAEAADELRITMVGPLCSLGLFVGFGLVATALTVFGAPELVIIVPSLLSGLNFMLALFNLVPAFPLDGGRVLRALLWKRSGDKLAATRGAARSGRAFGWLMIGAGGFIVASGVALSGIWLAFVGLFIVLASSAEAADVEGRLLLTDVLVRDIMTPDPITAPGDISVEELLRDHILTARASAYPVMDHGRVVGLVTLDRVRNVPPADRDRTTVRSITCPLAEVPVTHPRASLLEMLPSLVRSTEARALVLEDHRLVGIVSNTDVSRAVELRGLLRRGTAEVPGTREPDHAAPQGEPEPVDNRGDT